MKMRLARAEFLTEYPGGPRFPSGAVIDVPEAVADQWYSLGIAKKAASSTKTFADERQERLDQEREEAALNAQPVYNAMVTRHGTSPAEVEAAEDEMPMFAAPADDDDPAARKRK